MHDALVEKLLCPVCRDERNALTLHPFQSSGNVIREGVLLCPNCRAFFPIQDGLLELVVPA